MTTTRSTLLALVLAGCGNLGGPGGGSGGPNGGSGSLQTCPGTPAPGIFTNALCLCGDFVDVGNLEVGASAQPGLPSVGVNGRTRIINHTEVAGGWVAYGGMEDIGDTHIAGSLATPESLGITGNLEVGNDLSVGKTLSGLGRLAVKGTLRVGGDDRMLGFAQVAAVGPYTPSAGPPCPCEPAQLLDVAGAVAAAKAKNNNGSIANIGVTDLELPTGSYYFSDVATIGLARLRVTGAAAVFIDGDLDSIGAERISLAPGATLDLYVSGVVRTVGYVKAGESGQPSAFRLYVGGGGRLSLSVGYQKFAGSIYAPRATIAYIGDTHIEGGLFAKDVVGIGQLKIGAAHPVVPPTTTCDPAPVPPVTGTGGPTGAVDTPPIM